MLDLGSGDGSADRGSNDGLTVIITDFFTDNDWKKAVDYLCYKKRQVLLIRYCRRRRRTRRTAGGVNLIDAESGSLEDGRNMRMRITKRH